MKSKPSVIALSAVVLGSMGIAGRATRATTTGPSTIITHVTVLDGRGSAPLRNASVVVTNGSIAAVDIAGAGTPADASVIDARGGYLVPGFIDMHAHLLVPRCAPGPVPWPEAIERSLNIAAAGAVVLTTTGHHVAMCLPSPGANEFNGAMTE